MQIRIFKLNTKLLFI